jgi:hypothetical protein
MPTGDPVFTEGTYGWFRSGVAQAAPFLFGDELIARPLRVNDQIRIRSVRVIDENGEQLGILPTEEALARARLAGLDLIEVSPTAQPPVCKIADFGRLKYEQSKKDKDARKKQRHFELKEVKLRRNESKNGGAAAARREQDQSDDHVSRSRDHVHVIRTPPARSDGGRHGASGNCGARGAPRG